MERRLYFCESWVINAHLNVVLIDLIYQSCRPRFIAPLQSGGEAQSCTRGPTTPGAINRAPTPPVLASLGLKSLPATPDTGVGDGQADCPRFARPEIIA